MIRRCIALTDQPDSTNRAASQSRSPGFVGGSPRVPKSLGGANQPFAEVVLPDPVDHDAGRERVAGSARASPASSSRPLPLAIEIGGWLLA